MRCARKESPMPTAKISPGVYRQFFDHFQTEVGEWGEKTFPKSSERSIVRHLAAEVSELSGDLWSHNNTQQEAADCLLLLFHLAHKMGFSLFEAASAKFEVNKDRKWETESGEKGYFKHVSDET